jgi:VWFA-related protein
MSRASKITRIFTVVKAGQLVHVSLAGFLFPALLVVQPEAVLTQALTPSAPQQTQPTAQSTQSSQAPAPLSQVGHTTNTPAVPQEPTNASGPPLQATTRLVQLSVVVKDNHGESIAGLKRGDFTLSDNGKPQAIEIFSVTTNQPLSGPPPRPLPPNTYSNRVPGPGDAPANITVILLDALNTPFADQAFANQRVMKFLQQLQPQDRIALYTLGSHLRVLQDFTNDATSLLAALKNYKGQLSDLDSSAIPDMGNKGSMGYLFTKDEQLYESETLLRKRVRRTLDAMTAIANHAGTLPGRKNLIWVSGSFPLATGFVQLLPAHERMVFAKDVENTAQAITNEAMVIYPVDARGLIPPDLAASFAPPDAFEFMTMKNLAADTGGRAFFNTNDIGGAIRMAIDDSRVTYELGFYPGTTKWDGSFHTLKVKVNRPGAHVRTRKGYFALPVPEMTPDTRQARISQATTRLLEAHEIDLTVCVDAVDPSQKDSRTLSLSVVMDPHQLDLKPRDGRWSGVVDLVFFQLDDQYRIIHTLKQPYQLNLLPASYQRSPAEGFTLTNTVRVLPEASQLRVILRDNSTGMAGAVGVPLSTYFPVPSNKTN